MDDVLSALRNANILAEEDLLLFENYSYSNRYSICGWRKCKKVTILMLLIDLLDKYPLASFIINNIIKWYIEKVPEEMYKINGNGVSAIMICISDYFIITLKILLNNNINVNHQYNDENKWTVLHYTADWLDFIRSMGRYGLKIIKLLVEYDANTNIKDKNGNNMMYLCSNRDCGRVNNILENITLLNIKN